MYRLFACLFFWSFSLFSHGELTCHELNDIVSASDFFADRVFLEGRMSEGALYDDALAELVDGLHLAAYIEGDAELDAWADLLEESWVAQDWFSFDVTLQLIGDRLDSLNVQDC